MFHGWDLVRGILQPWNFPPSENVPWITYAKAPQKSWDFFPYQIQIHHNRAFRSLSPSNKTYLEVSGDWIYWGEESAHVTLHTRLPPVKSVSETIAVKRYIDLSNFVNEVSQINMVLYVMMLSIQFAVLGQQPVR